MELPISRRTAKAMPRSRQPSLPVAKVTAQPPEHQPAPGVFRLLAYTLLSITESLFQAPQVHYCTGITIIPHTTPGGFLLRVSKPEPGPVIGLVCSGVHTGTGHPKRKIEVVLGFLPGKAPGSYPLLEIVLKIGHHLVVVIRIAILHPFKGVNCLQSQDTFQWITFIS